MGTGCLIYGKYIKARREESFFYTLAEGIMILVKSLQRSEGDVSVRIIYIYS